MGNSLIDAADVDEQRGLSRGSWRDLTGKARRHGRAAERGYVRSVPAGFAAVVVASCLAPRLREMAEGLELTRDLEHEKGVHRRNPRHLLQDGATAEDKAKVADDVLRAANAAKHKSWLGAPPLHAPHDSSDPSRTYQRHILLQARFPVDVVGQCVIPTS